MENIHKTADYYKYNKNIISDKHLNKSVIYLGNEDFPRSLESKINNKSTSFESMYSGDDNRSSNHNYLSGLKNNSNGCNSENRYENYEILEEIDPDDLRTYWAAKEESQS